MQCLYSPNYFDHYSADMIATEDRMEIAYYLTVQIMISFSSRV